jgi:hypothetical protein
MLLRSFVFVLSVLAGHHSAKAAGFDSGEYVAYYLSHSDATAHVRILDVQTVGELMHDEQTGKSGYKIFEVTADVLEMFKGQLTPRIVIRVIQEQPSDPPASGEFIVSVDGSGSRVTLADDAVAWIASTPDLIRIARGSE